MTGWRVRGWALMGNHHHLSIETPEANLVNGMQWLHNAVTRKVVENHRGKLKPERRPFGPQIAQIYADAVHSIFPEWDKKIPSRLRPPPSQSAQICANLRTTIAPFGFRASLQAWRRVLR